MTDDANRTIEMYRLAESGTWDMVLVEIPANTDFNKIEEAGRIHADAQYGPGFYILYNSIDDDCPEVPRRGKVAVMMSYDMDQTTVGSGTEQEAAAVDQVNLVLQRQPHGLGARLDLSFVI